MVIVPAVQIGFFSDHCLHFVKKLLKSKRSEFTMIVMTPLPTVVRCHPVERVSNDGELEVSVKGFAVEQICIEEILSCHMVRCYCVIAYYDTTE